MSMGKKRKSEATRLDEVDRTIYSTFCSAANSLSLIYTQAMAHQKLAFQSGERHALSFSGLSKNSPDSTRSWPIYNEWILFHPMSKNNPAIASEKLYQLVLRHNEEGSRVTVADIVAYLQNEIDYGGEDASKSPSSELLHQYPQSTVQFTSTSVQNSSMIGIVAVCNAPRTGNCDQTKNTVFSNALSSPVCISLEPYHLAQGGASHDNVLSQGNLIRNHESHHLNQNQDSHTLAFSDSSMDMHSDSPARGPY